MRVKEGVMRTFTSLVSVMVATLSMTMTAHAQEAVGVEAQQRLTAEIFATALFPAEIVAAAQKADEIATRTRENRIKAECRLEEAEAVYDRVLRHPEIPVKLFVPVYEEYVNAIQALWDIDSELKAANEFVVSLYFSWMMSGVVEDDTNSAGSEGSNPSEVFQKWLEATQVSYISVSDNDKEMHRTMLNMGQYKINHDRRRLSRFSQVLECKLEM